MISVQEEVRDVTNKLVKYNTQACNVKHAKLTSYVKHLSELLNLFSKCLHYLKVQSLFHTMPAPLHGCLYVMIDSISFIFIKQVTTSATLVRLF